MKKVLLLGIGLFHVLLVMYFTHRIIISYDFEFNSDNCKHEPWYYKLDQCKYLIASEELASLRFEFPYVHCHTMPGYPLFLALIRPLTQNNVYLIALIQAILFVLASYYFLYSFIRRYNLVGFSFILCGALILFNYDAIIFSAITMTEALAASLLLIISGSLVNKLESLRDKILFSLSLPLLGLTRGEYMTLILPIVVYLYLSDRGKLKILIPGLGILFFGLVLNGLKNKRIFGVFRLTNFNAGGVIYAGNNLSLDGSWHSDSTKGYLPEKYRRVLDSLWNTKNLTQICVMQDSIYLQAAFEVWKTSWINQIKIIPTKFGKLWLWPSGGAGFDCFYFLHSGTRPGLQIRDFLNYLMDDERWPWYAKYKHLAILIVYWMSMLFSLLGMYFKAKTHGLDKVDGLLISFIVLPSLLYSTVFFGAGRYHVPMVSIVFYWSLYFFEAVGRWWTKFSKT